MKTMINSRRIAGVVLAIVAVLTCSGLASAQAATVGAFVLPFDVQWNGATLPAGQYTFTLQSVQFGGLLLIRDAHGNGKMLVVTDGIGVRPKHNSLTIVRRKGNWYVASLALEPIDTTLKYSVPSQTNAEREIEASIQVIPVRFIKS